MKTTRTRNLLAFALVCALAATTAHAQTAWSLSNLLYMLIKLGEETHLLELWVEGMDPPPTADPTPREPVWPEPRV